MKMDRGEKELDSPTEHNFLNKYVIPKILWTIIVLLVVVILNILINKFAGGYFNQMAERVSGNYILTGLSFFISEILIGIFPAELFMLIYQSKDWNEYLFIVLSLGIISSLCGFLAFLGGKFLITTKVLKLIVVQKKFKRYSDLFRKYGWIIIILAATTPLPFAMVSFVAGYFKFSPLTYLKLVIPIRICRFFISAFFIKYSTQLL